MDAAPPAAASRGRWVSSSRGAPRGRGGAPRGRGAARPARAAAAAAAAAGDPDKDAILLVQLAPLRRAKVSAFKRAALAGDAGGDKAALAGSLLDIREMYVSDQKYALPSKKGIALTLPEAEALFAAGPAILKEMRAIVAGGAPAAAAAGKRAREDDDADAAARKAARRAARAAE